LQERILSSEAGFSDFDTSIPNSGVRYRDAYGIIKFTLRDNSYDWEFVPEAGFTFTDTETDAYNN